MGIFSVEYLMFDVKSVIFLIEGTFTRILFDVQDGETFWNEMTCRVSAKPWFIYRYKISYDKLA